MPQKQKADNIEKREHLEKLYGNHADEIFRFALYKLSDREKAKDVVQDTFVKIWGHISTNSEILQNPRAFLFKIARNLVIDSYRKVKPMSIDALEEILHFDISDNHQAKDEMHDAVDMSIVLSPYVRLSCWTMQYSRSSWRRAHSHISSMGVPSRA